MNCRTRRDEEFEGVRKLFCVKLFGRSRHIFLRTLKRFQKPEFASSKLPNKWNLVDFLGLQIFKVKDLSCQNCSEDKGVSG